MTRAAPVLAAIALALAACDAERAKSCPGDAVVALAFTGSLTSGALPAGLDPAPAVPSCVDPAFPTTITFSGTLASEDDGAATLCRKTGTNLGGTRAGDRWTVRSASSGAMLTSCGPSCMAVSSVTLTGDVTPSAAAPTGFSGALIEVLSADPDGCGSCALPCAGRYTLNGGKEGP